MGTYLSRAFLDDPDVDSGETLLDPDLHTLAKYIESVEEASHLERERDEVWEEMLEMENLLGWAFLQGQDDTLHVLSLQLKYQKLEKQKEELTSKAEEVRKKGELKLSTGPLGSLLDPVLKEFNVRRQSYHSQAFVGNHVNTMLKEAPIKRLTSIATSKAQQLVEQQDMPLAVFTRARALQDRYERLFTLFAECHSKYSHAKPVSDEDISSLDRSIKDLMSFYRTSFPQGTVPIKMHLLEVHAVPWMQRRGFGLGFFGEQGIETTHAQFNNIQRATGGIRDETKRLKVTLERHLLKMCPTRVGGIPAPNPRKSTN
ncbi:uncharacterized protein [Branchiostoma lanceolatum]|uniref:uncharacterized protein n=1 Tax=Branchiostoma lanceolatum TaxID=7740 RepID=UPI00345133E2